MSPLAFRSDLLKHIREYFFREGLLEVTTPLLRSAGASDVHLDNLPVRHGETQGFLQTSPEYAMKILLSAHKASIFQICPAFRGGDRGGRHRVEFQMLEWYRCDYSLEELMEDLLALLEHLYQVMGPVYDLPPPGEVTKKSYAALFSKRYGFNPHRASREQLAAQAAANALHHLSGSAEPGDLLDGLFATGVEPSLPGRSIVFDYPACQAALAETGTNSAGDLISRRFEFFMSGVEIANAYQELTDSAALRRRFRGNNRRRARLGKPLIEDDEELLVALGGLPRCAGIALGVDRLAMVMRGEDALPAAMPRASH